jgi:acyl-coenzyme A synthetase/AMP-(fatty) acid ligase
MNIIDPIIRHAASQPQKAAAMRGASTVTYAQLVARAGRAAAELVQRGVQPGDVVGLRCESTDYIVMTLAVAWAGAVSVPFALMPKEQLERYAQLVGASFLVSSESQKPDGLPPGVRESLVLRQAYGSTAPDIPVADCADDATWRIGFSSGTTGERKAIRFTHASGAARSELLSRVPKIRGERTMVYLGYALTFAVAYWMRELTHGKTVVLNSGKRELLDGIESAQPDLIVASPGNAINLVRVAREAGRTLPASIRTVMLGGSAVSPAHRKLLREQLCDNLWINYGATEMGLVALLGPELMDRKPGCAGGVLPWVDIEAVDANGQPAEPGQPGMLRMRSPMMASGYVLPAGASDADVHAFDGGWFASGDRGFVAEGKFLYLAGRDSDIINLGGNKISPAAVERVLEQHPGVVECAVVGAQHRERGELGLFAFVVSESPLDVPALTAHCRAQLAPWQVPHRFVRAKQLPRNESGKVMRSELLKRMRDPAAPAPS